MRGRAPGAAVIGDSVTAEAEFVLGDPGESGKRQDTATPTAAPARSAETEENDVTERGARGGAIEV